MQNSMVVFTFSVLGQENPFLANLVQKIKIVCSKWSLIQRLIQIYRIKWCCPFDLFWTRNTLFGLPVLGYPFWANFVREIKKCQFELKIGTETNSNIKNLMAMFIFPVFDWKYPFFEICSVSENSLLKLYFRS